MIWADDEHGESSGGAPLQDHHGRRSPVLHWCCVTVVLLTLTALTVVLVTGNVSYQGPVLATFSATHGLHEGDVFVLGGWLVGVLALLVLALTPHRRRDRGT